MTETVAREPAHVAVATRSRSTMLTAVFLLAVLVCAVLAGAYVAYYQTSRPEVFRSSATLLIDQKPALFSTGNEGVVGKLSELRIKYTSLVGTEQFAQQVSQQSGLPLNKVQGTLAAVADPNTLLITVSARSATAATARTVAQQASEYLSTYIQQEQSTFNIKPADQVTLTVVTPASSGTKLGPSNRKAVLEGIAAFAGIAVVGLFIADLARRHRRT